MSTPETAGSNPTPEQKRSTETWRFYELQTTTRDIYEAHDQECGYGPDTMLVKLLGNAEFLKKVARKNPENTDALDRALTNVFIWTATVANRAQTRLDYVLMEKYGDGCQRCKQIPCLIAQDKDCVDAENFLPTNPPPIPQSINEWQKHLASIYPNNFANGPLQALKFASERLQEEVSELISSTHRDVERELSPYSRYQNNEERTFPWKGEISDVLAWGLGVAEAIRRLTGEEYSLEDSLKEKYNDGCPYCHTAQCHCPREVTIIEELSRKN